MARAVRIKCLRTTKLPENDLPNELFKYYSLFFISHFQQISLVWKKEIPDDCSKVLLLPILKNVMGPTVTIAEESIYQTRFSENFCFPCNKQTYGSTRQQKTFKPSWILIWTDGYAEQIFILSRVIKYLQVIRFIDSAAFNSIW